MLLIIDRLVCDVHCFINHKLQLCYWLAESLQAHHAIKDPKQKQTRYSYPSRSGRAIYVLICYEECTNMHEKSDPVADVATTGTSTHKIKQKDKWNRGQKLYRQVNLKSGGHTKPTS